MGSEEHAKVGLIALTTIHSREEIRNFQALPTRFVCLISKSNALSEIIDLRCQQINLEFSARSLLYI